MKKLTWREAYRLLNKKAPRAIPITTEHSASQNKLEPKPLPAPTVERHVVTKPGGTAAPLKASKQERNTLPPHKTQREKVVKWALWGCDNEPSIHYAQIRPMTINVPQGTTPLTTDCSGFATLCYRWAGAPDPNGSGYNGTGYTGTLLAHGKDVATPKAGDLVVFGPGNGDHVCIVVGEGPDPLLVSHGQEKGPFKIRLSEESRYQSKPVRFRSYL